MTRDEVLDAVVAQAGLSGKPTAPLEVRERNARELLPNDGLREAMNYLAYVSPEGRATSTCALAGCNLLRGLGCEHEVLSAPYIPRLQKFGGMAVSDVSTVAKAYDAYTERLEDLCEYPDELDILRIESPEHIVRVVGSDPATGAVLCVDGGQGDGRDIAFVRRLMVFVHGIPWLVKPDQPYKDAAQSQPNGRRVVARVVSARLPNG